MSLLTTVLVLLAAVAAAVGANLAERRPRDLGRPPLIPYTAIQVVAILVVILMLAHLVTLWSGTPLRGRLSR